MGPQTGNVDDCDTTFEAVDKINELISPLIEELSQTTFFNHYKVTYCVT